MVKFIRLVGVSIIAALVLSVVLIPHGAAAADYAVQPASGPAGTTFSFFATGYDSDEFVSFWANGPDGKVVDAGSGHVTASDGRADWTWVSPSNAAEGTWQMVARGNDSDFQTVIQFQVGNGAPAPAPAPAPSPAPAPGSPPDQAVAPTVGAPGSQFAFFATGFNGGERVSYWANSPNGSVVSDGSGAVTASGDNGRADWTWVVPADKGTGTWQMVAYGNDSKVVRVITFEVR